MEHVSARPQMQELDPNSKIEASNAGIEAGSFIAVSTADAPEEESETVVEKRRRLAALGLFTIVAMMTTSQFTQT